MQLPAEYIRQTRLTLGPARFERYMQSLDEEPPVSIRMNRGERPVGTVRGPVAWCRGGYYLEGRPQFTFDPLLHAGCYYVQEAASMFLDEVLRQHLPVLLGDGGAPHPLVALDLCAAPGGKSTILLNALPAGSTLVSNEPNPKRAQVLSENLQKWSLAARDRNGGQQAVRSIVTNAYPRDIRRSKQQFDLVLCDVPCSGEGMFRKDPATVGEWSPQNVEKCWRLQREIVSEAWACLRDGGLLVYSTCTLNTKENEENISWIVDELGAELLPVKTEADWNITGSLLAGFEKPVYRFIHGLTRGEGLFMAVLRKPATGKAQTTKLSLQNAKLRVLPNDFLDAVSEAEKAGCPRVSVGYEQAISYLRREAIALPEDTPRGLVVVCFENHALGLAKNIGQRANNLYPKEWRIKSTHIPQDYEAVFRHPE